MFEVGQQFEIRYGGDTARCLVEEILPSGLYPIKAFSQNDPCWKGMQLLGSTFTIGSAGCALCCAAMIISQVYPDVTPRILNNRLLAEGVADNGLLVWESISRLFPGVEYLGPAVRYKDGDLIWHNHAADVDRVRVEMAVGPTILECDYQPGAGHQQHFVLAESFTEDGSDLHIIDPIDGKRSTLMYRYSASSWDLARTIYGLRLLRAKE